MIQILSISNIIKYTRWSWERFIEILSDWLREFGNKPNENDPSEITNLILICLKKINLTHELAKKFQV